MPVYPSQSPETSTWRAEKDWRKAGSSDIYTEEEEHLPVSWVDGG